MTQIKKVEYLFKTTNKNIHEEFGKFVYMSFEKSVIVLLSQQNPA